MTVFISKTPREGIKYFLPGILLLFDSSNCEFTAINFIYSANGFSILHIVHFSTLRVTQFERILYVLFKKFLSTKYIICI